MLSRCETVAFHGMDPVIIDVQVQIAPGLPAFTIVGLGDKAVNESRERIRAAFHSLNISLPPQRVTVNLAPADFPKEGSHYDLPIALSILASLGALDPEVLCDYFIVGELGLDGRVKRVPGVLPASIAAVAHGKGMICPKDSAKEARWSGVENLLPATTILDVMQNLKRGGGMQGREPPPLLEEELGQKPFYGDFSEIKGQRHVKRALEVAAAGGHNVLLIGPPGAGKSMLSSRFAGILPCLTPAQSLEVTMIHSLAGMIPEEGLITHPPYRDPHHSATLPALVGGGSKCRPGEISLAHHGVLFLDEIPEFHRATLESLRQPLEVGYVSISRANGMVRYPCRVQILAAMNPCPCGYLGNPIKQCSKIPLCGEQYQQKLSGPLLDRFDIKVFVEDLSPRELLSKEVGEPSKDIAARVASARKLQYARPQNSTLNAHVGGEDLKALTHLSMECEDLLMKAASKFHLSARGFTRVLRVARTLADMESCVAGGGEGSEVNVLNALVPLAPHHISEALQYRTGY